MPSNTDEDVELELINLDTINIGEDFNVTVAAVNKSTSVRTLKIQLVVKSTFYNGIVAHQIDKVEGSFKLKPETSM